MVAPGAGFRGGTLYRPKNRWRPKRKGLCCKTSWFSVRKYVMTKKIKKRSLPTNQRVFGLKRKKTKNKWCHPKMVPHGASSPPSDATDSNSSCCLFEAGISSSKPSNWDNLGRGLPKDTTTWPNCEWNQDHVSRVVVKTTPLPSRPHCRRHCSCDVFCSDLKFG